MCLEVKGQSQEFPPSYINEEFIYKNWTARDGLPVNSISSIIQSEEGYLWLGTSDGLVRFNGREFKIYTTSNLKGLSTNRIKGLANYKDGILILNANNELIHWSDEKVRGIPIPAELIKAQNWGVVQGENGEIHIYCNEGVFHFSEDKFQKISFTEGLKFTERKQGDFTWKSFTNNLRWKGEQAVQLQSNINDVIIDKEGSLWLVTYSTGLYQIKKNFFETYSIQEGLPGRNIYPITESEDNTIWLGTFGNGIATIKDKKVSKGYVFEGNSSNAYVHSILQRKNNEILVALLDGVIYRYSGEKIFTVFSDPDLGTIYSLFEDSKERLWMGTSSGLFYMQNDVWKPIEYNSEINVPVVALEEGLDGTLWAGTIGKGLVYIKNGEVNFFGKNEGLSSDLIRSIWINYTGSATNNYEVWIGTVDNGLSHIYIEKGNPIPLKVTNIGVDEGLFDWVVHKIIPDDVGRVWMSSNRGIFWVLYHELKQFIKGDRDQIVSVSYTEMDGLRSREANGGIQSPGTKAKDGTLWFPTQDGVVKIDPKRIVFNEVIPSVLIEEIVTEKGHYNNRDGLLELELGDRNIRFKFADLSYVSPEKNQIRYRLFEFEKDWKDANSERSIRYTNLEPGIYTFKVIASNNSGVWNQQGAVLKIKIPAYFYESIWFYSLIIVFFLVQGTITYIVLKNRAQEVLKKNKDEIENLNSKIEELKLKINSQKELKGSILSNLSNEIRTPIVSLREALIKGREPIDEIVEYYSSELLSYVDQLLLLSEIEGGGSLVEPEPVNIIELIGQEIKNFNVKSEIQEPQIELSSNSDFLYIYMKEEYIKVVFSNLLKNTFQRKGVTKVRIEVIEESSICTVKIIDNGEALTRQELHTIFTLFNVQGVSDECRKTLNISLPLIAKLIELHKGTILVHSLPDHGNTYSVVLKKGSAHFKNQNV